MGKERNESPFPLRCRYFHSLMAFVVLCIFLITVELSKLLVRPASSNAQDAQNLLPETNLRLMGNEEQWKTEGRHFGEEEESFDEFLGDEQLQEDEIAIASNGSEPASSEMEGIASVVISKEQEIDRTSHRSAGLDRNASKGSLSGESGLSTVKHNETLSKPNGRRQRDRNRRSWRPGASILRKAAQL
eukprot:c41130_g1_i1 orf=3-563(-)